MYRQTPKRGWLTRLRRRVGWPGGDDRGSARAARRAPVMLRVFRDIPVPSWRIVFPEKLLQFRPLDGLRADLLTVAGRVHGRSFFSPHKKMTTLSLSIAPLQSDWNRELAESLTRERNIKVVSFFFLSKGVQWTASVAGHGRVQPGRGRCLAGQSLCSGSAMQWCACYTD